MCCHPEPIKSSAQHPLWLSSKCFCSYHHETKFAAANGQILKSRTKRPWSFVFICWHGIRTTSLALPHLNFTDIQGCPIVLVLLLFVVQDGVNGTSRWAHPARCPAWRLVVLRRAALVTTSWLTLAAAILIKLDPGALVRWGFGTGGEIVWHGVAECRVATVGARGLCVAATLETRADTVCDTWYLIFHCYHNNT